MLFGVVELLRIPTTDAVVVVPVPIFDVKLRIVLVVSTSGQLLVNMPTTCEAVPVAFSEIEFAIVPPTVFEMAFHAVVEAVNALIPYTRNVPEAPKLVTEIPPTLLLFDVQALELKL